MDKETPQTVLAPPEVVIWRFSLRRMLAYVAVLCLLLFVLTVVHFGVALVLLGVLAVVAAHVVSTVVGTKLRDGSTARRRWEKLHNHVHDEPLLAAGSEPVTLGELELPVDRQLCAREPATVRLYWFVGSGVLLGGLSGGVLLAMLLWHQITWPGLVLGSCSAAILGGWFAFLASSFYGISRRAWRDAVASHAADRRSSRLN